MKLLFQGGWERTRNPGETKPKIEAYCRALARFVVASRHQVILASNREYNKIVAEEIVSRAKEAGRDVKDILIYVLSDRHKEIPADGIVITFERPENRFEERTYALRYSDAVFAVGGGKGTLDCVEKAFLANKPVFVARAIRSAASDAWANRPANYHYINPGDANLFNDVNVTPEEFFREAFRILDQMSEVRHSRRIFVVHGRDLRSRDALVSILRRHQFEPVVLQKEASQSLTIIEKLEHYAANIGFAFVIYTPDDKGRLAGEPEKSRARQNVVFEHGLVVGLLGRSRTCALIKGDMEIPSDLHGMVFEQFDNLEEEPHRVTGPLKDAGYTFGEDVLDR